MAASNFCHPDNAPYLAVEAEDQGNPPRMLLFKTERAGVEHCKTRSYFDNKIWFLYKLSRIATVHPQQPKIYSEGLEDTRGCANTSAVEPK